MKQDERRVLIGLLMALLLLPSALSGCTRPPPLTDDRFAEVRSYGLGLDTSVPPGPSGAFMEPAGELAAFEAFLRAAVDPMQVTCPAFDLQEWITHSIDNGYHLHGLKALMWSCESTGRQDARSLAEQAVQDGNASEVMEHLWERAEAAMAEAGPDMAPSVGSVMDAMVQVMLGQEHARHQRELASIPERFASFEASGSVGSLTNAFLAPLSAEGFATLFMPWFRENYPWAEGSCRFPDVHEVAQAFNQTLHRIHALQPDWSTVNGTRAAARYLDPEDWPHDSIAEQIAQNDSATLLWRIFQASWTEGFWEQHGATNLPTLHEAKWIVARHRSEGRSVLMEENLRLLLDGPIEDVEQRGVNWQENSNHAILALALLEWDHAWPWVDVSCAAGT